MAKKMLQVIPRELEYTPAGGTAVTFTDFADPVAFTFEVTYGDIASQSSDYVIGKMLTGRKASLKAVVNNFDLAQLAAITSGVASDYAAATDTLSGKAGSFKINEGAVVFTGYDTAEGKEVTITLHRASAITTGDLSFGKDQEARVGLQFDAMKTDTGDVWTIAYATV
ncbi:hypothetical protein [Deinococcus ficus]|uniref:hypothetical protein n=1 Tax=Deinococcus ficus TaxID=317577 RepID=UPI00131E7648|nr:hypothetical protein [Deinococcus ficus]